jgi:aprataxin
MKKREREIDAIDLGHEQTSAPNQKKRGYEGTVQSGSGHSNHVETSVGLIEGIVFDKHYDHPCRPPRGPNFDWKRVLYSYYEKKADDPEVFLESKELLVVYDGFPKAKCHLLCLIKPSFLDARQAKFVAGHEDLDKLAWVHNFLRDTLVEKILSPMGRPMPSLLLGYHIIPSLEPLHIHIISDDLDSKCIKHKKHWNSFVTDYFVEIDQVDQWIREAKTTGPLNLAGTFEKWAEKSEDQDLLRSLLHCHKCGTVQKSMPKLKCHVETCAATRPFKFPLKGAFNK